MQVRSAVRALTLNVYSIEDPTVQSFVCSRPASNYFQELAVLLVDQCQVQSKATIHMRSELFARGFFLCLFACL